MITSKGTSKWLMAVPYALVFLYGLRMHTMSRRALFLTGSVSGFVFAVIASYLYLAADGFIQTQAYKYPPRLYYLSYAVAISTALYILLKERQNRSKKIAVVWISQNSLWIFLWHILFLYIWDFLMADMDFTGVWIAKFLVVLAASCFTTYMQKLVVILCLQHTPPYAQKWGKIILC